MRFSMYSNPSRVPQFFRWLKITSAAPQRLIQLGIAILSSVGIGLAVIASTYYLNNIKLLIGLIGGLVFVLVSMRWPEFGLLGFVGLLSGLISLSWLPALRLGPISLQISDLMLLVILGLLFLRATTQSGFTLIESPLMLPLLLFLGAILLSAANAIFIFGVGFNIVLRTVRVLILWIAFIPTLQLIRDEKALRRFLWGLSVLTVILLIGVLFPNRFEPFLFIEERTAGTGAQSYSDFNRIYYSGDIVLYFMIPTTVASLATIKKGNQIWRIGLLGLLLLWVFRTFFRNYWLTLFCCCMVLLVLLTSQERLRLLRRAIPVLAVTVLCFVVLTAVSPARVERLTYVLTDRLGSLLEDPFKREGSLQWRVIETRYALVQIGRHPILGIGLANSYRPPMAGESEGMYSGWAHRYLENGYLYIAVMMGLLGLCIFIWLCAVHILRVLRHQHRIKDDHLRAVYLGFGVAFLGMMVSNVVVPTFVFAPRLVFFPIAMAINEIILRLELNKGGG